MEALTKYYCIRRKLTAIRSPLRSFITQKLFMLSIYPFSVCYALKIIYPLNFQIYRQDRPSQIACTVTTATVTVTVKCTQAALRGHKNSCTVLIPLCKNNFNLPISHTDHYALRK